MNVHPRLRQVGGIAAALLAAACGDGDRGSAPPPAAPGPAATPGAGAASAGAPPAAARPPATAAAAGQGLEGRTRELVNPDASAMVFLYYDLAGITPPIEAWVEKDGRVQYAPAIEKAGQRTAVRAELESGAAAVRDVGVLRLSLHSANLSDYDPTYGEFTVRALAPSSEVSFDALGQSVSLRFGNGRTAQIWRVPADEAQAIRDKISYGGNVELDALLKITGVQPGPGGGTITADVLEYEMRESRTGTTIARVQLAPP